MSVLCEAHGSQVPDSQAEPIGEVVGRLALTKTVVVEVVGMILPDDIVVRVGRRRLEVVEALEQTYRVESGDQTARVGVRVPGETGQWKGVIARPNEGRHYVVHLGADSRRLE